MTAATRYQNFEEFFLAATENSPYPYQKRLAELPTPSIIDVPTGAGKTEAAILGWLWHRLRGSERTPRRLIYCLPRRALVEQTMDRVATWIERLNLKNRIGVAVLMGGVGDTDLEKRPEQEYIIIGTQDMLISGALNRAYGTSPYRWPVVFGLLNNDCMWVMDEVQIMENALPTSVQLDAFRKSYKVFGEHHTIWMSATIIPKWLNTVDAPRQEMVRVGLGDEDRRHDSLKKRNTAVKTIRKAGVSLKKKYERSDAAYLHSLHQKGSVTAIMVNTVQRAQELYDMFTREKIDCRIIHSRFRAADRREINEWIGNLKENDDKIIISTQVLEAGVDVSVRTLITELAPWSNLVQRFGRCNRNGTLDDADIYWIDITDEKSHLPYDTDDMEYARKKLEEQAGKSASPDDLPEYEESRTFDAVLRRRDMVDFFDTSSDLSGNYVDASRFVRTIQRQLDIGVFWRDGDMQSRPEADEVCSVPIADLKKFLADTKSYCMVWNYGDSEWEKAWPSDLFPGQTVMLEGKKGGYSKARGWDAKSREIVEPVKGTREANDSNDTDPQSKSSAPVTLEDHTLHVLDEARRILEEVGIGDDAMKEAVIEAARYHDIGKVHEIFQETMRKGMTEGVDADIIWAKSQKVTRHRVPGFRHEVASALAYIHNAKTQDRQKRDLVSYLIASHHGKVRLSLRNASRKKQDEEYLLGMKVGGDFLQAFSSRPVSIKDTRIDMSIARLGHTGPSGQSWTERMLALRDEYGPFRLAFLEMLVRAADGLASKKEKEGAYKP